MSISQIDTKTKLTVLKYLIEQNESFEVACSKSALTISTAKKLLASN
jgi:hypothetical protein